MRYNIDAVNSLVEVVADSSSGTETDPSSCAVGHCDDYSGDDLRE
jgi:hypothetical protein